MISSYNYNKLNIGDKMICIYKYDFTYNRLYQIEAPILNKTYTIRHTNTHLYFQELPHGYPPSWFIHLKEYRKQKLNKILI